MNHMMVPAHRNTRRSMLNELMSDPFDAFFSMPTMMPQKMSPQLMKTDIKETASAYELTIDLPSFKKDDVTVQLKDNCVSVTAESRRESDEKDMQGTFVRKERFSGKCSRSFYVGDDVIDSDIAARFEDGVLNITIPKKQEQQKLEESKIIEIN